MKPFVRALVAQAAAVLISLSGWGQVRPAVVQPPNVLVIVLDDLGTERLACYGQREGCPPTPEFDKLRRSGVLFTNATSNPVCSPSRACIQTGRYAFRTGKGNNGYYSLRLSEVTLAEMLKTGFPGSPLQYTCGLFGKWHLTTLLDYGNVAEQGYDRFEGAMGNVTNHFNWLGVRSDATDTSTVRVGSVAGPFDESTFTASVVRAAASNWIASAKEPFFACVCFHPPHSPYQVPPRTLVSSSTATVIETLGLEPGDIASGANVRKAYDWMIEAVDTEFGRLLAGIPPAKLERTTILVIGDNGTPEIVVEPPHDPEHAKKFVYQLGTLVPLLAAGPLVTQPNSTAKALVSSVDLWSTIAQITQARVIGSVDPLDSTSFLSVIQDPNSSGLRRRAFVQVFSPLGPYVPNPLAPPSGITMHRRGFQDGRLKLIRTLVSGGTYDQEGYDLLLDPNEVNDLLGPHPDPAPSAEDLASLAALEQELIALSGF